MPLNPTRAGVCVAASLALLAPLASGPAAAAVDVGVAAAVNPEATGRAGAVTRQLVIGKNILYNERIATSRNGLVQVLFVDGSTITVGPNSEVVIDKFVYNPKTEKGELVATFTKGALRFVGGKLSKNEDGVTVNAPTGSLGIRGGMFQATTTQFSFLFGDKLSFKAKNGQTFNIFQSGNTLSFQNGNGLVGPTPPQLAKFFLSTFAGKGGAGGGALKKPTDNQVQNSVGNQNSGNSFLSQLKSLFNDIDYLNNNTNENSTTDIIREFVQNNQPSPGPGPEDEPVSDFKGYATGMIGGRRLLLPPPMVGNKDPEQVTVSLDRKGGHVEAAFNVQKNGLLGLLDTHYALQFGGPGNSAYLDDQQFAAEHGDASVTALILGLPVPLPTTHNSGGIITAAAAASGNPDSVPFTSFCNSCDFIKWGPWTSNVSYGVFGQTTESINGYWVAGDVTRDIDMPMDGEATYEGKAVGMESERNGLVWSDPTKAHGKMNMSWNFGSRSGHLQISKFGAGLRSFGGAMSAPGLPNQFNGSLSGAGGLSGHANGSFVNNGAIPAAGVIGNFAVGSSSYQATGIFGGGKVP